MKYNIYYEKYYKMIDKIYLKYRDKKDFITEYKIVLKTNEATKYLHEICSNHLDYVRQKNENYISWIYILSEPDFLNFKMTVISTPGSAMEKLRNNTIKLLNEINSLKKEIETIKQENKEMKEFMESCSNDIDNVINDETVVNEPKIISVLSKLQQK